MTEHALFTWMITHLSRAWSCTDHVKRGKKEKARERQNGPEKVFEETVAEIFPKLESRSSTNRV